MSSRAPSSSRTRAQAGSESRASRPTRRALGPLALRSCSRLLVLGHGAAMARQIGEYDGRHTHRGAYRLRLGWLGVVFPERESAERGF